MIALRAPSLERALGDLALTTAQVVRSCRLEVTLPPGVTESGEGEALIVALDAASLPEAAARVAALPAGRRVAWVMPIATPGMVGWALARMRRVLPIEVEDACDALRRAGVIDVRVTRIDGALATVLVSGRTTAV